MQAEATATTEPDPPARGRIPLAVWLGAAGLAAAVVIGIVLVLQFVSAARERDLRGWQLRLGIVAESRKAAVESWLGRQWGEMAALADNQSIRLYLTELALAGGDPRAVADGEGQAQYLENLLELSAAREGFTAPTLGPNVPANVGRIGLAGLALLGKDGKVVVASRGAPLGDPSLQRFAAETAKGGRGFRDLYLDAAGQPALAFLLPIFRVQAEHAPDQQVGWALGVKEVAGELYPLLRQPGAAEASAEALLVRREDSVIRYLSPLRGHAPLPLLLAENTPSLAAASALAAPGGFGLARDYRDREVLYTSRAVADTPWLLIYKVDRDEALAASDRRQSRRLVVLFLAILVVSATLVAAWRHGASRRAADAAARCRAVADRLEQQEALLRLVTDSQPNAISIVDERGHYRFANRRAGEEAGIAPGEMIGKSLAAVLGPEPAKRQERLNREALETAAAVSEVHRAGGKQTLRVIQSRHIPLPSGLRLPGGVLIVEEDITSAIAARERHERTLDQLVHSLVAVLDQRDPYAAHHSKRVAQLSRAIAEEMGLSPLQVETAQVAGTLLNIGKVLVPARILTKTADLSPEEVGRIRDSLDASVEFLEGIEFDGPVVETLRQAFEHWDGSGRPLGLAGEDILPMARVVAVANTFVAMVSPRAHRPALGVDEAADHLLEEAGGRFDRGVVAALVSYLDNKGGRAAWSDTAGRAR